MANDIDMWDDIEEYEETGDIEIAEDLGECFYWRYTEYDEKKSEELKNKFQNKYGFWGNYY